MAVREVGEETLLVPKPRVTGDLLSMLVLLRCLGYRLLLLVLQEQGAFLRQLAARLATRLGFAGLLGLLVVVASRAGDGVASGLQRSDFGEVDLWLFLFELG